MQKWELQMQSTLLLLLLHFFYPLFPPLHTWKKNNLDFEKTLKILPPGQTPAGHACQSKVSQCNPLKDGLLFADDINDRTIPHLSPGCAKNYWDICQCIWDMVVVPSDPCRDEINEYWERQGQKRSILSFKLYFRQTIEVFYLTRKVTVGHAADYEVVVLHTAHSKTIIEWKASFEMQYFNHCLIINLLPKKSSKIKNFRLEADVVSILLLKMDKTTTYMGKWSFFYA